MLCPPEPRTKAENVHFHSPQAGEGNLHEKRLRDSLEMEREAVLDFMYTTVDSVSLLWQSAILLSSGATQQNTKLNLSIC